MRKGVLMKLVFLQKVVTEIAYDNVYKCTRNGKNKYGLPINDLLLFTLSLFQSLNVLCVIKSCC